MLEFGGAPSPITMNDIRSGHQYFRGFENFIKLSINKRQLLFSVTILNIDQTFVAEVKDNKLISNPYKYIQYASSKFLEIYNDYHIPVFQVDLDKKTNTITVNGLFYFGDSYMILSKDNMFFDSYLKPYAYLNSQEKSIWLDKSIRKAKELLKPIHE